MMLGSHMHAGSGSVLYARDGLGPPLRGDPLIVTLKQEKAALLAATDNDRGDKANLLATSKKALGQAAQLASDAAEARKRSSEAAFQMIAARALPSLSFSYYLGRHGECVARLVFKFSNRSKLDE